MRLLFALLALAGGAGIALYLAAALLMPDELDGRPGRALRGRDDAALARGGRRLLSGLGPVVRSGLRGPRRGGRFPLAEAATRVLGGVLVVTAAVVLFTAERLGAGGPLLTPAAFAGGLLLVVGPWLWRTAQGVLPSGRGESARRSAEVAARVRLGRQTLALIQRESADPKRVEQLSPPGAGGYARSSRRASSSRTIRRGAIGNAAAEVELHGVRVEVASRWECAARRRHARGRAGST